MLQKVFHPDKMANTQCNTEMTKHINHACEVLRDPDSRNEHLDETQKKNVDPERHCASDYASDEEISDFVPSDEGCECGCQR